MSLKSAPAGTGVVVGRDQTLSPGVRRVFLANLIAQIGIVVTGGLVRVTASGLGCPTWPECVDGSLVPTSTQAEQWHKYVEFGNRLLTFVLAILAVAAVVAAWRARRTWRGDGAPVRTPIMWLAAAPLIGTVAQALLGGVTVLTGLHPLWVAAHFLVSIVIIGACVVLVRRSGEPGDHPIVRLVRPQLTWYSRALTVLALVVLVMGTLVTGSGPHSGDPDVTHRLPFDQGTMAWLHADMVLLFAGMVLGLWLTLALTSGPVRARWWTTVLVALCAGQAVVGYTQWFSGLPWALVVFHMLMACLVWVSVLQVGLSLRNRGYASA